MPGADSPGGVLIDFEMPEGGAGFMARRRQDGTRDQLEKSYRSNLERRLDALERRLAAEPENPQVQRVMGLLATLEGQNERANAFFERAHALDGNDYETHVNYAVVLAKRGQLQPALTLLNQARQKWPDSPLILLNMAQIALAARRPTLVYQAVGALEKLWLSNASIAQDFTTKRSRRAVWPMCWKASSAKPLWT